MDETLADEVVAELRHELRTPINLVVGYCEMLLEDASGPAFAPRREALEAALGAVREALGLIGRALPPSGERVAGPQLIDLARALEAPAARILEAMDRLLAAPGVDADPTLAEDAGRVRRAAQDLTRVLQPYAAVAGAQVTKDASTAGTGTGRATILVVDDIEANRALLERRLTRDNHEVLCVSAGQQALAVMSTRHVDLVVLDVMMPDMDGIAVLESMKADPRLRELPVVMISALDDVKSVAACIERGADDYLPKPFDPVLLRARVGALLERKRLRDQELAYLGHVDRLVRAAGAIEEGTYLSGALDDVIARADELGRLARVLDGMAVRVRSREDRLHSQIRQLEAEIGLVVGATGAPRIGHTAAMPAAPGPLAVGRSFAGRYQVRALLGRGGMGTVYLADDEELGEPVAIKVLLPELVDAVTLQRFRNEIRLARRISHRNVVRTHDIGAHDGIHFVTMEYVSGITLRDLIDTRGRLGVAATLAIGGQLLRGLAIAHEEGILHRDIKPQNLLLDPRGVLKIMDFGIACLAERTTALTRAGTVVGTPAYMSPEQLLDEPLDARSDLHAAGVVLFEALTGRLPFQSNSAIGFIGQRLSLSAPAPIEVNADVPVALSNLVHRMLARSAADRPASAQDAEALLTGLGR